MTISEKIIALRKNSNMSQEELAEKLDVSRQTVSGWESGKVIPAADKVLALSELFNVSTDFLLRDTEEYVTAVIPEEFEEDTQYEESVQFEEEPIPSEVIPAPVYKYTEPEKKKLPVKKIVAAVISIILVIALIIPIPMGLYKKWFFEEPIQYPYVLVHGLGGYGAESKINETTPYWGGVTGNVATYLREEKGYEVYEASVGPFSSTWDRACELYAQLTGTTVDYGEAHSKAHNHDRYGRTYETKLAGDWGSETKGGQVMKLNLVGHSFGGATVRMLTSLLAYGSEEEKNASPDDVSELFKGGKDNLINSVTTLCSPHNGSTLYYCVAQSDSIIDSALSLVFYGSQFANSIELGEYYDFHLEHFGIDNEDQDATSIIKTVFGNGTDNAAYDLSPDGAAEINKTIKTVDNVYYFSYAYSATKESFGVQLPDSSVLTFKDILYLPATMIGSYSQNKVSDYPIDKTWLENDGMVNVISAKYPFTDEWQDYDAENIVKGKWNVMPVLKGHHGTVVGMGVTTEEARKFYLDLITMVDAQPRDKKYYFKGLF